MGRDVGRIRHAHGHNCVLVICLHQLLAVVAVVQLEVLLQELWYRIDTLELTVKKKRLNWYVLCLHTWSTTPSAAGLQVTLDTDGIRPAEVALSSSSKVIILGNSAPS